MRLKSLLFTLALVCTSSASAASLTTTFAGGNSQNGNMFDLINLTGSAIQISNIWGIHVSESGSNIPLELYYNPGGFSGSEGTPGDWTFAGSGSGIGQGFGSETEVTFSSGFTLPAFATYGIYITRTDGSYLNYTDGTVNYSDGTLQVTYGLGKAYPFSSSFSPRNWNGTVYYNQSAVPEPGSVGLLLSGVGALLFVRRRK